MRQTRDDEDVPVPSNVGTRSGDPKTSVYETINGAYQLIDEYLRQGQKVAEELWLPRERGSGRDAMFERFMRAAGDVGSLWLEMMSQWGTAAERPQSVGEGLGPFSSSTGASNGKSPTRRTDARQARLKVAIESARPCRVDVELHATDARSLETDGLHATDGNGRGVRSLRIAWDEIHQTFVLRVRVPSKLPPGAYSYKLMNSETRVACGMVKLSIA